MLLVFPISRELEKRSLEDMAIILTVRGLIYLPITGIIGCVGVFFLSSVVPHFEHYVFEAIILVWMGLWLGLILMDVVAIRRAAILWPPERLRSHSSISKLPLLVLILAPLYFFLSRTNDAVTWAIGMLWVFHVLASMFYLSYFLLLFVIGRLPSIPSALGFVLAFASCCYGFQQRLQG